MAITFRKTTQGFVNTWTQLKDIVSTKSLYNAADYENLSTNQKESYLTMLYANNDALAQRLPEEYNSEYGDTETRFALLSAIYDKYNFEQNMMDPEYRQQVNTAVDEQLNKQLSKDIDSEKSWVNWLVENKYDGNYAKFVSDYSGDNAKTYADSLVEMIPSEYELTEETFATGVAEAVEARESIYTEYTAAYSEAYKNTLEYVKNKIKENAEREAYENASTVEKVFNTIWQVPTLVAAETVEILEGLGDTIITIAAGVEEIFTLGYGSTKWAESAIKYDWWAPETWLGVETSNSYLSRYAGDNAAKWIHEIGVNIVDMVPLAIPVAGTAIYYASAAGKTMESELQQGYSFGEAFATTIGSTAIEFATEKISGSKFFGGGMFKKWERIGGINLAWKITHDAIGEGLEEVISEIGSDLWHGVVTGDLQLIGKKDAWSQLAKTFAIGGLVGGIIVGGNAAVQSHVISKQAVTFKNSNGKSFELSPAKAAVVQDFVQKIGERVEKGKTVSERTMRKFEILKDFKIQNTDVFEQIMKYVEKSQYTGKDITLSDIGKIKAKSVTATTESDYYESRTGARIRRRARLLELVRGVKNGTVNKDAAKKSFAEEAATLREDAENKSGNATAVSDLSETTGLDKTSLALIINESLDAESRDQNQKDFQVSGVMTLGKLLKMFGEDMLTEGLQLFEQYSNKTINEIIELAQLGTEDSAFNKTEVDTSNLSSHFANANFVIVEAKVNTDIHTKYTELLTAIKTLKKQLKHFKTADVKLFFTTGETVSTSFFVDDTLYINAAWLAEADIGRVKDIIISKYCVENARRIIDNTDKYKTVRTLLYETMAKVDNPNRSAEIMLQELSYIMFFQENNLLLKQVLAYAPDKSGIDAVIDYFDTLRRTYVTKSVQKAVGKGLTNMLVTAEEVLDTGKEPKRDIALPSNKPSVKDIIDSYQNMEFRSFPFITGKKGIPVTASKVQAMYLHMKNTYGFNKQLDLTRKINWIKEFTDADNYDGDGYARLTTELNKFQNVKTSTGYTRSTVPTNKTLSELLNYYIDATCGLMVFSNGVITESEMTTQVLNTDALSAKAEELAQRTDAPRDQIGTVADFLTLSARGRLLPKFQNIPIYVTFDTESSAQGYIIGDTNSGMSIVINLSGAAELQKKRVTIGGTRLMLDDNGELIKRSDGSFAVADHSVEISGLAYDLGHEIGHSIGMMLGFNGTFSETDIANAYVTLFSKVDRRKLVDSIVTWLTKDSNVRPEMRSFARHLGLSKVDIETSYEKADTAILKYINELNNAITTDLSKKQLIKLFLPLAEYLYLTGFAHEMFANGRPEAVAREDIIHSKLSEVNDWHATVLVTNSDLEFIKILNGISFHQTVDAEFLDEWIAEIQDSPENTARRVLSNIKKLPDLAKELNVKFARELTSTDFWNGKSKKPAVNVTRSNLISALEEKYDCTYDSIEQKFEGGYISKSIRDNHNTDPSNYSMAILSDGKVIDARKHTAYNDANVQAFIRYSNKQLTLHILPGTQIRKGVDDSIVINNSRLVNIPKQTRYITEGKVFTTLNALHRYLSSNPTVSKFADFDSVFNRVIEQANTVGRQLDYAADTIYITTDGKIYNLDINMTDWNGYAEVVFKGDSNKARNLLGYTDNFVADNPEGLSGKLISLLNDKRVVRLYRKGNSWEAYGIPNRLQNNFISELKAEKQNLPSYIDNFVNKRLFISLTGDMPKVEIHDSDWNATKDFHEIDWRNSEWYNTTCQIISKYNIVNLQDLELLGFSQDFIDAINSGSLPDFYGYLRDDTNTDFSRNILIENSPKFKRKSGSGDWKNNPNIRSISDAKEYWKIITVFKDVMPVIRNKDGSKTPVIFNSMLELKLAMEKMRNDPVNIPVIESAAIKGEKIANTLGQELYIQLLNYDSNYGLSLDKMSFSDAFNRINTYANALIYKRKNTGAGKDVGLETEDDEGHTRVRPEAESEYIPQETEVEEYDSEIEKIITERFEQEITDARSLASTELQNEELQKILERLNSPMLRTYGRKEFIRNQILAYLSSDSSSSVQERELSALKTRIEKYNELEVDSPEQLQERRSLIRLYEQIKNTKLDKLSKGGQTYYKRQLELLSGVGTYNVNMTAAFSRIFKAISAKRDMSSNPEIFDKQLSMLKETFNKFKQVDLEYPGWYKNYEKLLEVLKVWNDPSKSNMIDGKPLKHVLFDINTFLDEFINPENHAPAVQQKVTEFRNRIADRENKLLYSLTKNVRGSSLVKSDIDRFNNIPDKLKPLTKFPLEAQTLYEKFETNPNALTKFLQIPNKVETALKLYGEDFVYHLKRLYNDLTTPILGTGVSESKKDLLEDMMSDLGFSEDDITTTTAKVVTYGDAKNIGNKLKTVNYTNYSKFMAKRALSLREYLAAGKSISSTDMVESLRAMANKIRNYRWKRNETRRAFIIDFNKLDIAPAKNVSDIIEQYNAIKDAYDDISTKYARLHKRLSELKSNKASIDEISAVETKLNATELEYNRLEDEYKAIARQYYGTTTVVYDETSHTYKAGESNSVTDRNKRQQQVLRESYIENLMHQLRGSDAGIIREGNKLIIHVSEAATKRYAKVEKLLNKYFGSKDYSTRVELDDKYKVSVEKTLAQLTRGQKYRITTALNTAYYNFMSDPQTDRSRDRFESDITNALQTGKINATIPGDTKRSMLSIQVPQQYITPLESGGKEFTQADINDRLKHIFNADLISPSEKELASLESLKLFSEDTDAKNQAIDNFVESHKTPADKLRAERLRYDRYHATRRSRYTTVISEAEYADVEFSFESGTFVGPDGEGGLTTLYPDLNSLPAITFDRYLLYNVNKGIDEGWLKIDDHGNVVDVQDPEKVVVYNYDDLSEGTFTDMPDANDFIEGSSISNIELEDFDIFDTNVLENTITEKEPTTKGTWLEKTATPGKSLKSGLSANTARMLDYQPRKWDEDGSFSSAEFIEDNAVYLARFTNSESDMNAFVSRIESNPSVPINSPQEAIIFALLNKVYNRTAVTQNTDLHNRTDVLIKQLSARAGRTLGMTKKYGVVPAEQLATLCSKMLSLTDEEKQLLADVTTVQENAIATYNYARANEAMEAVLGVIRKHASELPTSMNVFAKGLSAEERTARWTNIANNVSSWKYFAMLGSPTTFFTKNIASNVIITGMDAAAETVAKLFQRSKTLSGDYSFKDAQFDTVLVPGTKLKLLSIQDVTAIVNQTVVNSADARQIDIAKLTKDLNAFISTRYKVDGKMPTAGRVASRANEWMRHRYYQYKMNKSADANVKAVVKTNLRDNGLLAGIMSDQVAKYDRGYDVKIGKLRQIVLNEETELDDLSEANASVLASAIKKDNPFSSNPNNILNKYYRFIFKTMELGDKKFIEPKIVKTVEKLVASNMTDAEVTALQNGNKDAHAKFNDFVQFAVDDAMKTYFRGNSEFQKKIMRLFNGHPIAQMIFGTIMPFPRMAINTMSTALSYSPAGFIKAIYIASTSQDAFTRLKVSKELGKAFIGSTLIGIGAALAAAGILDFDDDDEYAGVQLVLGNVRIALNDLAPSALPMVIGATMTHGATEGFWNSVYAGGNALLDATLLGEAIEVFGGNKASSDIITDTFSSFVNQFMPSALRHIARTIDPTKKKYSSNKGVKIIQRIGASIPGISLLVPYKVDPYTGDAVYQNAGSSEGWARILSFANAFSPTKVTIDMRSDVEEESKAVGAATTGPAKTYKIDGIEYTISEELYRDYQILRAKLYNQYAQATINTAKYKNMSLIQKQAKLKRLQNQATQEARKQLNIGK